MGWPWDLEGDDQWVFSVEPAYFYGTGDPPGNPNDCRADHDDVLPGGRDTESEEIPRYDPGSAASITIDGVDVGPEFATVRFMLSERLRHDACVLLDARQLLGGAPPRPLIVSAKSNGTMCDANDRDEHGLNKGQSGVVAVTVYYDCPGIPSPPCRPSEADFEVEIVGTRPDYALVSGACPLWSGGRCGPTPVPALPAGAALLLAGGLAVLGRRAARRRRRGAR